MLQTYSHLVLQVHGLGSCYLVTGVHKSWNGLGTSVFGAVLLVAIFSSSRRN